MLIASIGTPESEVDYATVWEGCCVASKSHCRKLTATPGTGRRLKENFLASQRLNRIAYFMLGVSLVRPCLGNTNRQVLGIFTEWLF